MRALFVLFSMICAALAELNLEGNDQEVSVNLPEERILTGKPTTYKTWNGFTFTGKRAQAIHLLKARFTASASTYNGHSDGPLMSADLWANGAKYGVDNSRMPQMNNMADFISKNLNPLNVRSEHFFMTDLSKNY